MSEFKTFMSLVDSSIAEDVIKTLKDNNIALKVQDTSKDFDVTFSGDSSKNSILIMLYPNDFEKASIILENNTKFDVNEIDPQHPFFNYNIADLKDVVKNYDEWHPLDVRFAKYLLGKENIIIDDSEILTIQKEKIIQADKHEKSDLLTLSMGYLFCMLGGLAGIGIAIFLLTGKRRLSNGTKEYIYSKSDRAHGVYMLILGALFMSYYISKI
uniref:hypothetical protein n=2 Tax=Flavobacterium sp. TaxID=239 RepID=UPI00404A0508